MWLTRISPDLKPDQDAFARSPVTLQFSGAPLDAIKVAAAVLMVGDHLNSIVLDSDFRILWRLGRIAYPLFCFVLVCNLLRGAKLPHYLQILILFGVVTQPIHGVAFSENLGNVLFTLAIGAVVAMTLRLQNLFVQHIAFAAGTAAIFCSLVRAKTGVDFGLAGMLFPAALLLVLEGKRSHVPWLICLLIGLNWGAAAPPSEAWFVAPLRNAAFAGVGGIAVVMLALSLKGRPRFLPQYALYLFYPAHLIVLVILRGFGLWPQS